MIHFLAAAGDTKAGTVAAEWELRFSEALAFLHLVLVSHHLTQVKEEEKKDHFMNNLFSVCFSLCPVDLRIQFFWLNECHESHGSHGSHESHDNHGDPGRWRVHLILFNIFWRRWRREHGQLPLCVHLH